MENLLDKKQVAELLNISVKTLDLWKSKGTAPKPVKLGRLVRFKPEEVKEFIDELFKEAEKNEESTY
jgi:excisionase family DNA binding protein